MSNNIHTDLFLLGQWRQTSEGRYIRHRCEHSIFYDEEQILQVNQIAAKMHPVCNSCLAINFDKYQSLVSHKEISSNINRLLRQYMDFLLDHAPRHFPDRWWRSRDERLLYEMELIKEYAKIICLFDYPVQDFLLRNVLKMFSVKLNREIYEKQVDKFIKKTILNTAAELLEHNYLSYETRAVGMDTAFSDKNLTRDLVDKFYAWRPLYLRVDFERAQQGSQSSINLSIKNR